jgi:sugar phosphate isomerase/epimerase
LKRDRETDVPDVKIALQIAALQMPLKLAVAEAARLGVAGVVLDARDPTLRGMSQTGGRQLRKMLQDLGLAVPVVSFHTRRGYDAPDELDRRVAATKEAMELASRLGARVVVNQIGRPPADPQSPEWASLVEVLQDLGRHGQRVGAMLAAETGSQNGADLARVLTALPEGTLGVDLNPGRLFEAGFSPVESAAALGPWIYHVHATDAADRMGRVQTAPLGRGDVDYPAFLAALDEARYRGYFTIQEFLTGDPDNEVAATIRFLRSCYG